MLSITAAMARGALWLLVHLLRWRVVGQERLHAAFHGDERILFALWHGRIMLAPKMILRGGRRITVVASRSSDGEFAARVLAPMGVDFARGSTRNTHPDKVHRDKGGREAMAVMIEAIKAGHLGAITPDGPRGPHQRAQPGVAIIAKEAEAAVVPVGISGSWARHMRRWDQFLIVWPFARAVVVVGDPLRMAPDESIEGFRLRIETALNTTTAEADRLAGRVFLPPAPLPSDERAS